MRQHMTNELAVLAYWSVRQKLNRINSVHLRRSVRALTRGTVRPYGSCKGTFDSYIKMRSTDQQTACFFGSVFSAFCSATPARVTRSCEPSFTVSAAAEARLLRGRSHVVARAGVGSRTA